MKARIYMIPCPISESNLQSLSPEVAEVCKKTRYYVVERAKTARKFLKNLIPDIYLPEIKMIEMDHKDSILDIHAFLEENIQNGDIGVISEAGCPGVADPGHMVSLWAHEHGISVQPLVGPSAILLALMSSGLQGQKFQFLGYLPAKKPELIKQLRTIEQQVAKSGVTTLFIETPYRNQSLYDTMLETLSANVYLSISMDITGPEAFAKTASIATWKKNPLTNLPKLPAMFVLGTKNL